MTSTLSTRRLALLLVAVAVAVYLPALTCGFVWDDDDYVTQNPVLRTAAGIWRIWFEPTSLPQYYPLVHTTFWLEYRLWGAWAPGYHAVNIGLHAASAVLLWSVLRRLVVPGALFAALLFAVHPIQVESVAWVTERKNVLSLLCYLLAARGWLRWQAGDGGGGRYWASTAWFAAALLAKTVVASLPAALVLVTWWRHGRVDRRTWRSLLPWFALGLGLALVTVAFERTVVRAAGEPWQLVGAQRLLVAGRAPWFYVASFLWPLGLCFNYPRWHLDTGSSAQWAFPAAIVLSLLAAFLLRRRLGRGLPAGLAIYLGTLVPALGFFDVYPFRYSFVADHFQYHASVALASLLAALLAVAASSAAGRVGTTAARVAGLALIVGLSVLAWRQVGIYRDLDTLWTRTLACNPASTLALTNLGGLALDRVDRGGGDRGGGDLEQARRCFARALELDPGSYEAAANLGVVAHKAGDRAGAERFYRQALALRPDLKAAMHNLAVLHLDDGHAAQAWPLLEQAIAIDPDYYDARVTGGRALAALGRWADVVEQATWVLARTPDAHDTRLRAAEALLALGQAGPAAGNAAYVAQRQPSDARAVGVLAKAMARLVAAEPAAGAGERAIAGCRNAKVDPARLLPLVADELRAQGATAHAQDVAARIRGG